MDRARTLDFLTTMAVVSLSYGVWRFGSSSLRLPAVYAMLGVPAVVGVVRWWRGGRKPLAPRLIAACVGAVVVAFLLGIAMARMRR